MPIDHNIYFKQRGPESDPFGSFARGMKIGDMMRSRKENDAIKESFARNTVKNPDGSVSVNRQAVVGDLYKINPEKAMALQQQFIKTQRDNEEFEQQRKAYQIDMIARVAPGVKDQSSYDQGLQVLRRAGVDVSGMKPVYDANTAALVRHYGQMALSAKDQMAQKNWEKDYAQRERAINAKRTTSLTGKAPKGYRFKRDGSLEPIPGGPEAGKAEKRAESAKKQAGLVVQDLGRAITQLDKHATSAGPLEGWTSIIPGTHAWRLEQLLDSVKANIGFDKLQEMRAASPTGGALGQVSDAENKLLQATAGKLDTSMPEEMLLDNMKRLYNQYNDIIHGKGNGPQRFSLSFDELGNPIEGQGQQTPMWSAEDEAELQALESEVGGS